MEPVSDGAQLGVFAKKQLEIANYCLPYNNDILKAVFFGKHLHALDEYLRDVAFGFLQVPVFQEISLSTISNNKTLAQKIHTHYHTKYLVITTADSLEDKILLFPGAYLVLDVIAFQFLMASQNWINILEQCSLQNNHFVIFGTLVKGKYTHHQSIPKLNLITLVPQFLTDTNEPAEIEVGVQRLKKPGKK